MKSFKEFRNDFRNEYGSVGLSDLENDLFWAVVGHTKRCMHKIPWFILSVPVLHDCNLDIGRALLNEGVKNSFFIDSHFKTKYESVDKKRYECIVVVAVNMVVINRGWLMRLQWLLQMIAITIGVGMGIKLL